MTDIRNESEWTPEQRERRMARGGERRGPCMNTRRPTEQRVDGTLQAPGGTRVSAGAALVQGFRPTSGQLGRGGSVIGMCHAEGLSSDPAWCSARCANRAHSRGYRERVRQPLSARLCLGCS
jgi:hypothetical protein